MNVLGVEPMGLLCVSNGGGSSVGFAATPWVRCRCAVG